jgi:hypothetical protein
MAGTPLSIPNDDPLYLESADEIERLRAENERLRAALAQSDQPCAYCSLPADEWARCDRGFPGCARADDAMGCPHLGSGLEVERLRAELSAAIGYMTNAQIDLKTGAPKRTALATIEGGIKRARAAMGEKS